MTFQTIEAAQADQIERAFSSIQDGVSGVMIPDDSLFFNERKRIAEEALTRKISDGSLRCAHGRRRRTNDVCTKPADYFSPLSRIHR